MQFKVNLNNLSAADFLVELFVFQTEIQDRQLESCYKEKFFSDNNVVTLTYIKISSSCCFQYFKLTVTFFINF